MTTSSLLPSLSPVVAAPPPAEATFPVGSTYGTPEPVIPAALVVVVVSTLGTISGVAALDCVCEEDASITGSVMVKAPPATAALAVESGLGAGSPPPWGSPTAKY
jgi:hypothetical protein